MAARDKLGSTVSLQQGVAAQSGAEAIPREYHRKVLKKITQLTKVIYNLNTKNDEHEEFVQRVRSLHEAEVQRLLADSASRLERYQKEAKEMKEAGERREGQLRERMKEVDKERDRLMETQVSYRKEVGDRLGALKSEHTQQIQQLTEQLERLKNEQSRQVKEIAGLHEGFAKKTNEQLKVHEKEMGELTAKSKREIQKMQAEITSLTALHQKERADLKQQYHCELETQRQNLANTQSEFMAAEARKWEEREASLRQQFLENEELLKRQVSTLSNDLRSTRDKLALSEQRLKELELHYEENKLDSSGLKEKLSAARAEVEELRGKVNSLHSELDIAREQYRQQSQEMKALSTTLSKLEALRVSNEGVIGNLHSQISGLQQKVGQLEGEREALQSSQRTSGEQLSTRIRVLEKELDRISREKQELHTQYAREIEAAHAQLGQKETELGAEHLQELQVLRDKHQLALQQAHTEKVSTLEELKRQFKLEKEGEIQSIVTKHMSEAAQLRQVVEDKTSEFHSALAELEKLRAVVTEKEEGLGSATGQVERLRGEVSEVKEELRKVRGRWEEARREGEQLKCSVESLQQAKKQAAQEHQEEVERVRTTLTWQLEQQWRERIKQECASLRAELSQRYSSDSHTALAELANLKDGAMREAQGRWEEERRGLMAKIDALKHKLKELHQSTAMSLEEANSAASEQISNLKRELEVERMRHREEEGEMRQSHQQQLLVQQQEFEEQKKHLTEELHSQHSVEVISLQRAHQVAVGALRDQLQQQGRENLRLLAETHSKEMDTLCAELSSQHKVELEGLRQQHGSEVEQHRRQLHDMLEQRKREASNYEHAVEDLNNEVGRRDTELCKLRDKVNNLTVSISNLKKELEAKNQEVHMVKRETTNQFRFREQQLSASHHVEMESLASQHKHTTQLLLADFNQAKELLNRRLSELEKQLAESERRYHNRESRPEDLEAIRDLRVKLREQEQKMKELVAEKRIYQLELVNREKNYNKLFSANPHVGVLDPLQIKPKKKVSESSTQRHASAPSLTSLESSSVLLPPTNCRKAKKDVSQHSASDVARPRKLVTLQDSPLTQQKLKNRPLASHSAPLEPIPPSVNPPKQTMLVQ